MTDVPPPPAAPAASDGRNDAKLAHIIGGIFPFWGGLIFWLVNKDKHPFAEDQSKEAFNFGINVAIALVISGVLMVVLIGFLLYPAVWIFSIISGIKAGSEAEKGVQYRYPFCPLRIVT